jgi:hypothetical protein
MNHFFHITIATRLANELLVLIVSVHCILKIEGTKRKVYNKDEFARHKLNPDFDPVVACAKPEGMRNYCIRASTVENGM